MDRQVVITGIGMASCLGMGREENWRGLVSGTSGIRRIKRFDPRYVDVKIAGEIDLEAIDASAKDVLPFKAFRRSEWLSKLSVLVCQEAIMQSGIDLQNTGRDRFGVYIGNADGTRCYLEDHIRQWRKRSADLDDYSFSAEKIAIVKFMQSAMATNVSLHFQLCGPVAVINLACSSSLAAIGMAYDQIRVGNADVMLAGGVELFVNEENIQGFQMFGTLSKNNESPQTSSRPFERRRSGMVLSDGAAILVLEEEDHARRRSAPIMAKVCGYSVESECYNIAFPDPSGNGMAQTMRHTLDRSAVDASDIGFVSAHGTATQVNDKAEASAIHKVFGMHARSVPVSAIKSMIGHSVGASGAIQAAATTLTLMQRIIPPTINYEEPDPNCDIRIVGNEPLETRPIYALVNTFALGGHNCSLILKEYV